MSATYRLQKDGVVLYRHGEPRASARVSSEHVPDVSAFLMASPGQKSDARKLVWHRVSDSQHLGRFCFDPEKNALRIQYQDGSIYQYENCSKAIYEGMLRADAKGESVGAYIARYLKNPRHPFVKVK